MTATVSCEMLGTLSWSKTEILAHNMEGVSWRVPRESDQEPTNLFFGFFWFSKLKSRDKGEKRDIFNCCN